MSPKRNTSNRYDGLDFAKFLCAFMVICIHMSYYGKRYFKPLTRCAVPVFFMITGYFYLSVKQNRREWAQIKKTIILFISSSLLYLIWNIAKCFLSNESIPDYIGSILSVKALIKLAFFNQPSISGHLWYLSALVYVLLVVLVVDKYSNREKLYKFIPFLLFINIVFGSYSTIILGAKIPLILTRNFLFCGLPFFLLGDVLRKKQNKFSQKQILAVAIFSVFLTMVENIILLHTETIFNDDCFIATPFLAFAFFMFFLENHTISNIPFLFNIAQLGKGPSTTIYIIHPIVISIAQKIIDVFSVYIPYITTIWLYIGPAAILILCTLFAWCFRCTKTKCNQFLQTHCTHFIDK